MLRQVANELAIYTLGSGGVVCALFYQKPSFYAFFYSASACFSALVSSCAVLVFYNSLLRS